MCVCMCTLECPPFLAFVWVNAKWNEDTGRGQRADQTRLEWSGVAPFSWSRWSVGTRNELEGRLLVCGDKVFPERGREEARNGVEM